MKWLRTIVVFDRGEVVSTSDWKTIHESCVRAVRSIDFPEGTGTLRLRRKSRRPDGQWNRNGVGYLRKRFLEHMVHEEGWRAEVECLADDRKAPDVFLYPSLETYREPIASSFGDFDLLTVGPSGIHMAIEWETGNISSSHRSMNKLAIALRQRKVCSFSDFRTKA